MCQARLNRVQHLQYHYHKHELIWPIRNIDFLNQRINGNICSHKVTRELY